MSPSASALRSPTSSPASARRRTRCRASRRRSARSTGNWFRSPTLRRRPSAPSACSPIATRWPRPSRSNSPSPPTARAPRRRCAGRRRSVRRRDEGGAARDLGGIATPRGRTEAEARALCRGGARSTRSRRTQKLALSRQALDEEYAAELAALQRREALGEQSLAAKQRVDDMIIEATRRRDDEIAALTRSALAGAGARLSVVRQFDQGGLQFAIARTAVRHGEPGAPPSRACWRTC